MGDFPTEIVELTAHRPWPVPDAPWIMTQSWHDLLFAHWPVPVGQLRARVPAGVDIDLFEDQAWIGIVPFRMTNVAPRLVPTLPFVSAFNELNVRTYVTRDGKPGVYFFSLDADSRVAVRAARSMFGLPYYDAKMAVRTHDETVAYDSRRTSGEARADLQISYRPVGPVFEAVPGSLEHFLTERYCLYTFYEGDAAYRVEILHPPWQLQPATAEISLNTMAEAAGVRLPQSPPQLHFARRQDVVAWPPTRA